jgi:two-component system chemotaxis response regulator CheY
MADKGKNTRILVVDDMTSMRKVIAHLLGALGYRHVAQACDGKGALLKLERSRFDLVITDWNMPGMNGLQLLKHIRGDAELEHLPVLMITTEGSKRQVIEAATAGVNSYIMKPFSAAMLQQKIDKIFE